MTSEIQLISDLTIYRPVGHWTLGHLHRHISAARSLRRYDDAIVDGSIDGEISDELNLRCSLPPARAEHVLELVGGRHLQLIVPAVFGSIVGPPAEKNGGVAEAVALHVVVLHLADPLDP